MKKIILPTINHEQVAREIEDFIIQEIAGIDYTGGVIGLSGGVDSTLTAALSKRAFDRYNQNNPPRELELVAYMLPTDINNSEDTSDGRNIAEKLGIRYEIIEIQPVIEAYKKTNPETFKRGYDKGNLMAEIRATILHQKAATEKKLVIGTGNFDEDYNLAYYTLYGDGAVHLSPIGGLSKRLVKEMAMFLGHEKSAKRTPTAALEKGQTDFKDLGYYYETGELIVEGKRQGLNFNEIVEEPQVGYWANKGFEDYKKLYGILKLQTVEDVVENIFFRNKIAKAKGRIVSPPIAEITKEYTIK